MKSTTTVKIEGGSVPLALAEDYKEAIEAIPLPPKQKYLRKYLIPALQLLEKKPLRASDAAKELGVSRQVGFAVFLELKGIGAIHIDSWERQPNTRPLPTYAIGTNKDAPYPKNEKRRYADRRPNGTERTKRQPDLYKGVKKYVQELLEAGPMLSTDIRDMIVIKFDFTSKLAQGAIVWLQYEGLIHRTPAKNVRNAYIVSWSDDPSNIPDNWQRKVVVKPAAVEEVRQLASSMWWGPYPRLESA